MPARNQAALDFLGNRRSRPAKLFTAPVPARAELEEISDRGAAGARSWQAGALAAGGDRKARLRAAGRSGRGAGARDGEEEKIAKGRGQYDSGQLAVVVIASPVEGKVPAVEQLLSAGALCMNIVNAATAAGWGACWLTGWPAHDAQFRAQGFGCAPQEIVAGIIHIGTPPADGPDRPRPELARVVSWAAA
ncbi:nitroreductase [Rhodobacter sp.]